MADPLSIAGLVTGVISLGLQVAGGLFDYLDAVKGRRDELDSAKRGAANMRDLLLTIKNMLPQLKRSWPKSAIMIERHLKSCDTELGALNALLSNLTRLHASGSGFRHKLADQKNKLTYPFNRSHITNLENRLARVNGALQTAVEVAGLNVSITSADKIDDVHDASCASVSKINDIHGFSITSLKEIRQVHDSSVTSEGKIDQIHDISVATASKINEVHDKSINSANKLDQIHGISTTCLNEIRQNHDMMVSMVQSLTVQMQRSDIRLPLAAGSENTESMASGSARTQFDATKYAIEYRGLTKLLKTAFVLSFINTYGAGGGSISQGFTYYPTVDEKIAPAFRIMDLAWKLQHNKHGGPIVDVMFSLATGLRASGVPTATCDSSGLTPAGRLFEIDYAHHTFKELVKLILPVASDVPLVQYQPRSIPYFRIGGLQFLLRDSELAEASGCGPLSLAARAGNEELVKVLVKQHPQSLEEVNHFGVTPLHLAVEHPSCLRLILDAGGSPMLEATDYWCRIPLDWASALGCRTSTQILIASGSPINYKCIWLGHRSCMDDLLVGLKQRRHELKLLALGNLTQTQAEYFRLHEDSVLDTHAFQVQGLLRKMGVHIPSSLAMQPFDAGPTYEHVGRVTDVWDKLWALGFCDVNTRRLPLLCAPEYKADAVRWLMEHGADYWTPFGEREDLPLPTNAATPAHFLFYRNSHIYPEHIDGGEIEARRWVVRKLSQVQAAAQWYVTAIQTLDNIFNEEQHIAALGRMTFDALRVRHTCCNFSRHILPKEEDYYYKSIYTPEEANEIHSEESSLLGLLADLLLEFEHIAHEDQNGVPLIVRDPVEFWMCRWLPRIMETLDSLDGDNLTKAERLAAEAVGVVWSPLPARPVEIHEDNDEALEYNYPEYVMREVRKIMNEQ
ncbi:hypothetical protein O1611_g8030 [Lasiodiplodia mahajangana]|uniref:Uncharacterized protein n=1 Tax=Lasiodiplodia mahajangana TaxID=1108764 RepID=A0ACC2JEG2_9PEZI|nr:hypothetical protein O1611_g8030 [Lasiodiplodia mahajangana]